MVLSLWSYIITFLKSISFRDVCYSLSMSYCLTSLSSLFWRMMVDYLYWIYSVRWVIYTLIEVIYPRNLLMAVFFSLTYYYRNFKPVISPFIRFNWDYPFMSFSLVSFSSSSVLSSWFLANISYCWAFLSLLSV